jgi:hypothetical protein|tara:strand:+ start:427 stop:978 length:552 start_codon:yes stop_codon:yes gene_type:complete
MIRLFVIALLLLSSSFAFADDDTIRSDSTVRSDGTMETTINSPPPSAISPQISTSNSDLCTVGVAGAVQTQILGISAGRTVRDMNCEKLKNAKALYNMGMKVAAISTLCQDSRVFDAMLNAGTPCPYMGLVGDKARVAWEMETVKQTIEREQNNPMKKIFNENIETKTGLSVIISTLAFLLFL